MSKPVYTDEFRQDAVNQVVAGGKSAAAVAREVGVPASTLRSWVRAAAPADGDTAPAAKDDTAAQSSTQEPAQPTSGESGDVTVTDLVDDTTVDVRDAAVADETVDVTDGAGEPVDADRFAADQKFWREAIRATQDGTGVLTAFGLSIAPDALPADQLDGAIR